MTTIAFAVRTWSDPASGATRVQVLRVDRAGAVRLVNASFLVRLTFDPGGGIVRCRLRHIASGREAYVQGGPGLRAFVADCLLGAAGGMPGSRADADGPAGADPDGEVDRGGGRRWGARDEHGERC